MTLRVHAKGIAAVTAVAVGVAVAVAVPAAIVGSAAAANADPLLSENGWLADGDYDPAVPTVQAVLGFAPGDRPATVDEILVYVQRLDQASDRVGVESIGRSVEGDPLLLLVITDPANLPRLRTREADMAQLRDPRRGTPDQRRQARERTLPVTWIACSTHGDEASGADAGLRLAYQLAAGRGPATRSVLERSVVLIDPCQNPDGRRRFTTHVRAFARAVPQPDELPAAVEHVQSWPGGRRNHYLFDLNRDWIYVTQPETRARVAAFLRWRPQVFADLHEMHRSSSYYFPPPADPINPNVSPQLRDWWELFGRANAAAFDGQGYPYFVRETYDLFYPGYGDSWPSLQGAVGMTFEQGTTRGLRLRDDSGEILRYVDTVRRHFLAAWTTCATAAAQGAGLLAAVERMGKDALELAARDPVRAIVIDPSVHPACARRLATTLAQQGIEALQTTQELQARVRPWGGDPGAAPARRAFPPGAWILPYDQPSYPLLRSLLDQEVPLDERFVEQEHARKERGLDDRFYDVTAWSMILSYDVAAYTCDQLPAVDAQRIDPMSTGGTDGPAAAIAVGAGDQEHGTTPRPVAWLLPYQDDAALAAACALLREGVHVWVCRDEVVREGQTLAAGTFVVKAGGDADGQLAAAVEQAAAQAGATLVTTERSWSDAGPSLGSDRVAYLRTPRIMVIAGEGTRAESVGAVCWLLEQRLRYPYTAVFVRSFDEVRLSQVDVLVVPDLEADELDLPLDALDAWMRGGGTLVAIGRGAAWLAGTRSDWTTAAPVADLRELDDEAGAEAPSEPGRSRSDAGTPPVPRLHRARPAAPDGSGAPGADSGEQDDRSIPPERRPDRVPGAIGRVMLDPTHFLAFGQHDPELFVPILSERIFQPSVAGRNVGLYDERVRVAGFVWPKMEQALRGAAYVIDEPCGEGHLVLFAEDPVFRGAWEGTARLLANALLLAPSLDR